MPPTEGEFKVDTHHTDGYRLKFNIFMIRFNEVLSFENAPILNAFPDEMKETVLSFLRIMNCGNFHFNRINN